MQIHRKNTGEKMSKKHDNFRRLAESRTNKALEAIRRIGNLSNPNVYAWEAEEAAKVVKVLEEAVAEVGKKFAAAKKQTDSKFTL